MPDATLVVSGTVAIRQEGDEKTICATGWGFKDAAVTCKHLAAVDPRYRDCIPEEYEWF